MIAGLQVAQLILAVVVIGAVLIQVRSSGMGSALGGSDSSFFSARRGIDRVIFNFTIAVSVLFFVISVVAVRFQ